MSVTTFQRARSAEQRAVRRRAILETAAEGIVSCDEQGTIMEFNAAAERIFGYDSEAVTFGLSNASPGVASGCTERPMTDLPKLSPLKALRQKKLTQAIWWHIITAT